MGVLEDLLGESPSDTLRSKLEAVGEWAVEEPAVAAVVPFLMTSVLIPGERKHSSNPALVSQTTLFNTLSDVYRDLIFPHLKEPLRFTIPALSMYRNGQQRRDVDCQLPLTFLVWLSNANARRTYGDSSPTMRLLALFNPVAAVEAFLVHGDPLPRFEDASPKSPLLRAGFRGQIDEAERNVSAGLKTLLGLADAGGQTVYEHFYVSDAGAPAPQATFMLYRRAVEPEKISKAFLIIEPPRHASDLHSFTLWRRSTAGLRESRGFILSLQGHYVFIGATGTQARRNPVGATRPLLTEAVKSIVIDWKHGIWDNDIWPALALTHGPTLVPVAARCVLVRSRHDHSDKADLKAHLELDNLEADLRAHAQLDLSKDGRTPQRLAQAISRIIDNAWEPDGETPNLSGPLQLAAFPPKLLVNDL